MNSRVLARYNFRVLMHGNWWLLVFPLAASQLSVFWGLVTQRFTPVLPAQTAEQVSPLLAAFLAAHLLSAEYQSRIGAIVASKPVDIGKVVVMRLTVVMALVWFLGLLSLVAFYFGMSPYNIILTALAGLPSTLFLALFALTFATLLRSPLAGFGVAALYWALDLPPGPPIHVLLSLRSYATALGSSDPLNAGSFASWWVSKLLLLALAVLLYKIHGRLIFGLGTPLTQRNRRRALGLAIGVVAFYIVSGAGIKVGYGYANRGTLDPDDGAWFRSQFASFGPVPVARLFGGAFWRYVGEIPNAWRLQQEGEADRWGDSLRHRTDLHLVVEHMSGSVWAPSAADLLARLEARRNRTPETAVPFYRRLPDKYPGSPYEAYALRMVARTYLDSNDEENARKAYEELLKKHPQSAFRSEALRYLVETDRARKNYAAAEERARQWVESAPIQERYLARLMLADLLKERGDRTGARAEAQKAVEAIREYRTARREERVKGIPGQVVKWDREANEAEERAKTF